MSHPAFPTFSCRRRDARGAARLVVAGELDVATTPQLDEALRRAEADAPMVVLDLQGLEFVAGCGVMLMLAAERRIRRAGGRLVVVRAPGLDRMFALVDAERRLDVVDRLELPESMAA